MISTGDKKNAVWNTISFLILQIFGFIIFTLNIKSYPGDIFGFYLLLTVVFNIFSTVDFGFGISTIRFISEAKIKKNHTLVNSIYSSLLITYVFIAFIFSSLLMVYYVFYGESLLPMSKQASNLYWIFAALTGMFFFSYIGSFFKTLFEGFSYYVLISRINIMFSGLNVILMLVIFVFKLPLLFLALFNFSSSIFNCIFLYLYISKSKHFEKVHFSFASFDFKLLKKMSGYSITMQLSLLVGSSLDAVIKFLLASLLSLNVVTYFESSKKVINMTNGLILSAQRGLFNKLSEHISLNKLQDFVNNKLFIYSKLSNYYSILIYGILNPLLCYFIFFWFKSFESVMIFLIFMLPYSLINFGGALYAVLMVEGKGLKLLFIQISNVVITFVALYFSIILLNNIYGLLGFYVATILSIIIIFYFLSRSQFLQFKAYSQQTNFKSVIQLSIILFSQILITQIFSSSFLFICIIYFLLYSVWFRKYLVYFVKLFIEKVRNWRNNSKYIFGS